MTQFNHLSTKNKVLIYEDSVPLLITPEGILPISQADLATFKNNVNKSDLQKSSLNSINHMIYSMKQAYQAALHISTRPSLSEYHLNSIQNAHYQFEEVETTLSHLYRIHHQALRNRTYGEALFDKVLNQIGPNMRVLEIGCGTGYLANSFLSRLLNKKPEYYKTIEYSMFDLSSALLKDQKKNCNEHINHIRFIHGDIQNYQFEEKYDLIICNEMIADLEVSAAKLSNITNQINDSLAEGIVLKYNLSTESAPPLYLVNTGAINLIEKLSSLLNDNGMAIITEFGTLNEFPVAVKLSGHFEHSIRFRDLVEVAQKNHLSAQLETVGDFLDFDKHSEVLSRDSYALLSDLLLPHLGMKRLERLPYSHEMLVEELGVLVQKLINLTFYPLHAQRDLLNPYRFMVLQIRQKKGPQ